jgi:outer membrane protein insertion porin family
MSKCMHSSGFSHWALFGFAALLWLVPSLTWAQLGVNRAAAAITLPTEPTQYEIGGITVTGTQYLDANTIISLTGLKVGDKIMVPGEDLGKALHKLWDQGLLGDADVTVTKIEGTYLFLNFELKERPRLSKFAFKGIKKGQADDLRKKIKLIRGKVVTDALLSNTRTTIRKYFLEKGFMNARVNVIPRPDSVLPNSVVLTFNVDKGERVKIASIDFEGNEALKESKLRGKLKKTKEKHWYKLFTTSKFLKSGFEEDKRILLDYYQGEGYRDAAIVQDTVYSISPDRVAVKLRIDEGRKYYFRHITWTGNYLYDSKYLNGILGVKPGEAYSKEKLEKRVNYNPTGLDVTSLYMNDGYLFFSVDPVEVLVEGDSIDIEMRLNEGQQARIREVTVEGNTKTSDHVILRELYTIPGQKFSREDIIRSQRELATLGYFDPEKVTPSPVPNPQDGTVDINWTVVEKPSDQVTLSGGWGGPLGFTGTVGLVFNNFSLRKAGKLSNWQPVPGGDGQRIGVSAQANGRSYQSYSLTFTEPWLGGHKPNSFSVSLSKSIQRSIYSTEAITSATPTIKINGASVSLGRRLQIPDTYFTLSHALSFYQYRLNNYGVFPGFSNGDAYSVSIMNTLSRNSIDNPTFPRRGSSLSFSVNLTPPYSLFNLQPTNVRRIEFNKWMFDASWFTKVVGNLVLNARAHFGFVSTYRRAQEIGPFERFKLGGSGLGGFNLLVGTDFIGLRGYEDPNAAGALPNARSGESGGVAYNKYVLEMRYPVSLNPSATIYALAFTEAGNSYADYATYNPYKLYRSAGAGVRIFMAAFGLLGFDYGYGFDNIPGAVGQKRGQFHFTIGQQIR